MYTVFSSNSEKKKYLLLLLFLQIYKTVNHSLELIPNMKCKGGEKLRLFKKIYQQK